MAISDTSAFHIFVIFHIVPQTGTSHPRQTNSSGSGLKASDRVSRLNAGLHVLILTN